MTGGEGYAITLHDAIAEIGAGTWDSCAADGNPFTGYAFLSALEDSGSVGGDSGWYPRHAVVRAADGTAEAVVPLYVKTHSHGEYVFDHGWARAFEQAGGRYYPKWQAAVPFSPVPGARLLCRPGGAVPRAAIGRALARLCASSGLSSVHVTFCTEAEQADLVGAGWLPRLGAQFHWTNAGYASFDDFLAALSSRKRKTVRKERRSAQEGGLRFRTLRGTAIGAADWDAFHGFYRSTVDRKWGEAYLRPALFPLLSERLGDKVVLMVADHGGRPVAAALNLLGADTLYGRNWGVEGDWPFLHFELCYYRAIEFAIDNGIARVEAGAQGEHKVSRGYLPTPTHSAHHIQDDGLRRAVARFVAEEREHKLAEMAALATLSPYRRDGEA